MLLQDPQSFHRAIGTILGVAQCFGLLPLAGVRGESPRMLRFKKVSLRTVYALLTIVLLFIMTVSTVISIVKIYQSDSIDHHGTRNDVYIPTIMH